MAALADLPSHLHEHAKAMPDGLLASLHPGEANHRLQAVHEMYETADRISNPEIHRHIRSHAKRLRDSMSYQDFTAERDKLRRLRDTAPNSDVKGAYMDALHEHESKHEQVAGVGEAIMRWDKAHPEDMPVAKATGGVSKAVERELARVQAEYLAKQAELRAEIAGFRAEMERRGQR